MNRDNQLGYAVLIVIGFAFLMYNLRLIPTGIFQVLKIAWPVLLILVGLYILLFKRDKSISIPFVVEDSDWSIHVGDRIYYINDPLVKAVFAAIAIVIALGITIFALFGIVAPVLVIVFTIVGIALLIAIGVPLVAVLFPILLLASPLIVLIWLLSLLF